MTDDLIERALARVSGSALVKAGCVPSEDDQLFYQLATALRSKSERIVELEKERPVWGDAATTAQAAYVIIQRETNRADRAEADLAAIKSRIDEAGMARIIDPDVWRSFDRFPSPLNPEKVADSLTKAQALRTLILGEE